MNPPSNRRTSKTPGVGIRLEHLSQSLYLMQSVIVELHSDSIKHKILAQREFGMKSFTTNDFGLTFAPASLVSLVPPTPRQRPADVPSTTSNARPRYPRTATI